MRNVYEEVQYFYEQHTDWEPVIKRDWVESFLRQKAWQGTDDENLRSVWHSLEAFLNYLIFSGTDDIESITYPEYSLMIEWFEDNVRGFKVTLKPVRRFFNTLVEFYKHLVSKKVIRDLTTLEMAAHAIAGGRKLQLYDPDIPFNNELSVFSEIVDKHQADFKDFSIEDISDMVSQTVEKLMAKLGNYFQQENFSDDFRRALFLYTGPFRTVPNEEDEDFWLGFWDYFLFDYRLLATDVKPLDDFERTHHDQLAVEEQRIIKDLINAQFSVFYVSKILNPEWVECCDLFTEQKFNLPHPDFDYSKIKQLLFFGHVFAREMIMVNYVTSIEISCNLRRRIQEEVIRQRKIHEIQRPGATWGDFFNRHALAVRHTIDILLTQAKVNVTPFSQMERVFPASENSKPVNPVVTQLLAEMMPRYSFSIHDVTLAQQLWHDYSQLQTVVIRKPASWAASVIYVYSQLNSSQTLSAEILATDFDISTNSLYQNRRKLDLALQLERFDPRYLNEEGFILSLFTH